MSAALFSAATIGFGVIQYFVSEAEFSVDVTVSLFSGSLDTAVTVNIATMDGSAIGKDEQHRITILTSQLPPTAPSDYTTTELTLTFNSSITTVTIPISIIDDDILETNETFLLRLSSEDPTLGVAPSDAMITIIDDDSKP